MTYSKVKASWILGSSVLAASSLALLSLNGCGKAPTEATPSISLAFGTYTASNSLMDFFIPSAQATIMTGTKVCFKRLRFKSDATTTANPAADPGNLDFQPGEIALNSAVTSLGKINVPAGTYRRVEFDLAKDGLNCLSGNSVNIVNSAGTFVSTDTLTIKFEGTFVAASSGQVLSLGVQSIIDALNAVTASGSGIKTALEGVSVKGNF